MICNIVICYNEVMGEWCNYVMVKSYNGEMMQYLIGGIEKWWNVKNSNIDTLLQRWKQTIPTVIH